MADNTRPKRPWKTVSCYPDEAEWRVWRQWAFESDVKMSNLILASMRHALADPERKAEIENAAAEIDLQRRS